MHSKRRSSPCTGYAWTTLEYEDCEINTSSATRIAHATKGTCRHGMREATKETQKHKKTRRAPTMRAPRY